MYSFIAYIFQLSFQRTILLFNIVSAILEHEFPLQQFSSNRNMYLVKVSLGTIPLPFLELFLVTLLFFLHFWHSGLSSGIVPVSCALPLESLVKQVCWLPIHLHFPPSGSVFFFLTFIPNGYFRWIENYELTALIFQHFLWTNIDTLEFKFIVYSDFLPFYMVSFPCSRFPSVLSLYILQPCLLGSFGSCRTLRLSSLMTDRFEGYWLGV